jgi:hypothetical protein
MKQRNRTNQLQAGLFDEPSPNKGPNLLEMPADRSLELEAAIGELLLKAATRTAPAGGDHDA